jgi:hypothetical protein
MDKKIQPIDNQFNINFNWDKMDKLLGQIGQKFGQNGQNEQIGQNVNYPNGVTICTLIRLPQVREVG